MIVDQYGRQMSSSQQEMLVLRQEINRLRTIRARYDAAQTVHNNEMHWSNADFRSPASSNDYHVRRALRSRSRYETIENNSYLKGMALTKANDFAGSGPKLQITDQAITQEGRKSLEKTFSHWFKQIKGRHKIWQMRMARFVDGEAFAVAFTNMRLASRVKADWKVVEADQITNFELTFLSQSPGEVDGIRFDTNGEPESYFVLNKHPGDQFLGFDPLEGQWLDYRYVLHWFRADRPWQRSIPETTAALPLCAILRRYTLATLSAAEFAADVAGMLESEGMPSTGPWGTSGPGGTSADYSAFDSFPVERGMFMVLPRGYKMSQMDAKHPTAMYDKFVEALLREIARALQIPLNIAIGFSGGYNFASGTLDRQIYQGGIDREREHFEDCILERMFQSWLDEALLMPGYLPSEVDRGYVPEHVWRWDRIPEHADPLKVAQAAEVWYRMRQLTDEQIQMERFGRDPEEHWEAVVRQEERHSQLPQRNPGGGVATSVPGTDVDIEDEEGESVGRHRINVTGSDAGNGHKR